MPAKLVCRNQTWLWVEFTLQALPDLGGYGMIAACDYGDHWLAEEGAALVYQFEPYAWTSAVAAIAAGARYEREHEVRT